MKHMHTDCYCTQLRRVSSNFTKIYDDALRSQGLKITQFSMLRGLARLGESTLTGLADELALERSTMSRGVKVLIDAGWVNYSAGQDDAREKILKLSDRGKKKLQAAMPSWTKAQAKIEAHLRGARQSAGIKRLVEALEGLQDR